MAEAVATRWEPPQVVELAESITQIEFRDSVIRVQDGLVISYTDKELKVTLQPSEQGGDAWSVLRPDGASTGQLWRGLILFDGQQLLIQQAKNAILRLYKLDGAVETQFRTCRVVETPGERAIFFQNGVTIVENVDEQWTTVKYEDRTTRRKQDDQTFVLLDDESWQPVSLPETGNPEQLIGNEAIDAFNTFLKHWSTFQEESEPGTFMIESPPGLREAAPGHPFRRQAKAKADDFRECRTHDFEDGTYLHEYFGRLNGAPYTAHDVVALNGLVLARFVEYDQPRQMHFLVEGTKVTLNSVLSLEVTFDPQELIYKTTVVFADGTQRMFPQ
jgi:hypothetical protein